MKRSFKIIGLLFLTALGAGVLFSRPASADVIDRYVRRAGDYMTGKLTVNTSGDALIIPNGGVRASYLWSKVNTTGILGNTNGGSGLANIAMYTGGAGTLINGDRLIDFFADGPRAVRIAQIDNNGAYVGKVSGLGSLNVAQIAAPSGAATATSASGGTLAAGTYCYRVSALSNGLETTAASEVCQVTSGTTSTVTVTWNNVTGADSYKVYGRTTGAELLMGTNTAASSLSFVDTGSVTPSGALPASNGTGALNVAATSGNAINVGGGNAQISGGGTIIGTSLQITGSLKAPIVHGSGTAQQAIESATTAATANALAVTFSTAFGAAPNCTCADVNAAPAACGISVAATTSGVTFKGTTGATDPISWICVGQK